MMVDCFVNRHAWRAWNEALEQKQAVTHMDSVALHFWAYRIQAQVCVSACVCVRVYVCVCV